MQSRKVLLRKLHISWGLNSKKKPAAQTCMQRAPGRGNSPDFASSGKPSTERKQPLSISPYIYLRASLVILGPTFTHSLEMDMATHSSTLAWKIPWTEEPGRLQSMGSQSWTQLSNFTHFHFHTLTAPTLVFQRLPWFVTVWVINVFLIHYSTVSMKAKTILVRLRET